MRTRAHSILVSLAFGLAACGGGSEPGAPMALGQYVNATTGATLYVLEDGKFYLHDVGYYLQGAGSSAGTSFTGSGTRFAEPVGASTATTVSGSFTPQWSMDLELATGDRFTGKFVPEFLAPATLQEIEGHYETAVTNAYLSIDASGNLAMVLPDLCTIRGTVRPHGSLRIYDADLVFGEGGAWCEPQRRVQGVVSHDGYRLWIRMDDGFLQSWDAPLCETGTGSCR